MRNWILFGFVVLVVAYAVRYLLPSRIALDYYSGGTYRTIMPINRAAFWLVLAVGGIVILVKLIALWFRRL